MGALTFPADLKQKVIRPVSMTTLNKEGERCSLKILHGNGNNRAKIEATQIEVM